MRSRLTPDAFLLAAVLLLTLGIAIFAVLSWLTRRLIGHWHESALPREE